MKNTTSNKKSPQRVMDPKDIRSEVVHFKVSARENLNISMTAKRCGMTVSSYVRARALGYEPVARMTIEERDLITKLAQCRSDIANFINAINGLSSEEKRRMFRTPTLMEKWISEVKPIADAVSEFIREIRNRKMLRSRTANEEGREVMS